MSLLVNFEDTVELNKNTLRACGWSKGVSQGMTEYINLELSGNDNGGYQLTKGNI